MEVRLQDIKKVHARKVASDELAGNTSKGPFKICRVVRDQYVFVRSAKSRSVKT